MGLFGLFYMLFCGGANVTKDIKGQSQAADAIVEAEKKGEIFCIAKNGKAYHAPTHREAYLSTKNIDGIPHRVIVDAKTGFTLHDYTAIEHSEIEKKRIEECLAKGGTAYRIGEEWEDNAKHALGYGGVPGYRYRDIKTGEIYVVRYGYGGCFLFVKLDTLEAIRVTQYTIDTKRYWQGEQYPDRDELFKESINNYNKTIQNLMKEGKIYEARRYAWPECSKVTPLGGMYDKCQY